MKQQRMQKGQWQVAFRAICGTQRTSVLEYERRPDEVEPFPELCHTSSPTLAATELWPVTFDFLSGAAAAAATAHSRPTAPNLYSPGPAGSFGSTLTSAPAAPRYRCGCAAAAGCRCPPLPPPPHRHPAHWLLAHFPHARCRCHQRLHRAACLLRLRQKCRSEPAATAAAHTQQPRRRQLGRGTMRAAPDVARKGTPAPPEYTSCLRNNSGTVGAASWEQQQVARWSAHLREQVRAACLRGCQDWTHREALYFKRSVCGRTHGCSASEQPVGLPAGLSLWLLSHIVVRLNRRQVLNRQQTVITQTSELLRDLAVTRADMFTCSVGQVWEVQIYLLRQQLPTKSQNQLPLDDILPGCPQTNIGVEAVRSSIKSIRAAPPTCCGRKGGL